MTYYMSLDPAGTVLGIHTVKASAWEQCVMTDFRLGHDNARELVHERGYRVVAVEGEELPP